jgi:hypothetical protein
MNVNRIAALAAGSLALAVLLTVAAPVGLVVSIPAVVAGLVLKTTR